MTDNKKPPYRYKISATLVGTIDLDLLANDRLHAAHRAEQRLKELCTILSDRVSSDAEAKILPDRIWVDWEQTTGIYQREGIMGLDERSI